MAKTTERQTDPRKEIAAILHSAGARSDRRRLISVCCLYAGCLLWCVLFWKAGAGLDALPWYVTILAMGLTSVGLMTSNAGSPDPVQLRFRETPPLRLHETWAASCLLSAVALLAVMLIAAVVPTTSRQPKVTQFIDIELTSNLDAQDKDSPLPGTAEAEKLRKRVGDKADAQGQIATMASRTQAQVPSAKPDPNDFTGKPDQRKPTPKTSEVAQSKPILPTLPQTYNASVPVPNVRPSGSRPEIQSHAPSRTAIQTNDGQPFLEEVEPPELVEVLDNDGDADAMHVFQSGGNSKGGKGAGNDLSNYLRDLQKRIKHAWTPPRGQSSTAEIVFRLKKSGGLAFIKVVRTSGDPDTDLAATTAVSNAAQRAALPASYTLGYLDVRYTFNYTADELKEVSSRN